MRYDAIVIGGGHNGLVHAAYLARAGRKVLVLERRHVLGGAAVTEEVFPGFRFSVCSYVVSLLRPEIIRELDLPQARPRDPAARRHVHADAERRLPVAHERSRPDAPRDCASLARGRRGVRRVLAGDGRDGAVREADSRHDAAGSVVAEPARARPSGVSRAAVPRARARRPLQPGPAHDHERRGFPGPVVRDRRAEGDDVGERDHRDVPRRAIAGHGLRAAAPLHGRDRRRVPLVGPRAWRHRRDLRGDCGRGTRSRRRNPHQRGGREDQGQREPRARRRARQRGRVRRRSRGVEPRPSPDVHAPDRRTRSCRTSSSRA